MTLQDAILSGRSFKRSGTYRYITITNKRLWHEDNGPYTPPIEDILATDWELKELEATLKRASLEAELSSLQLTETQQYELLSILDKLFEEKK